MTCKTCIHWQTKDGEVVGECRGVRISDPANTSDFFVPEACDGWGEPKQPPFLTGPDFGCVHFCSQTDGTKTVLMSQCKPVINDDLMEQSS